MKGILLAVFLLLVWWILVFPTILSAEEVLDLNAHRMMESDGDTICPFSFPVGSVTPVSPSDVCPTTARTHRTTLIINPSASYYLMVSTWAGFTAADPHFIIPPSSGSWSTSNHQKIYVLYPTGGGETVCGSIESN